MSENPTTVTLPYGDWELLLDFVQLNANRQEVATDLWASWGDEIARLVRTQLSAAQTGAANGGAVDDPAGIRVLSHR